MWLQVRSLLRCVLMLCAHTRYWPGPVEFDFDIALERNFRLFAVRRTATMLDTRLSPPNGSPSLGRAIVYILLDGELHWHAPQSLSLTAPGGFVAPLHDVVGGSGKRSRDYSSGGPLYQSLQLWVPALYLARPVQEPTSVVLSASTLDAARAYAAVVHRRGPIDVLERARILAPLLAALQRDGVLNTDLAATIEPDEGVVGSVWKYVAPWFESMALSGSLDSLASRAGLSIRQMGRRLDHLGITFELPWIGWRALARGMRLRLAVLLLSNPDLSIAAIADGTGYSSAEALAHALRAEGLPSPSEVRRRSMNGPGARGGMDTSPRRPVVLQLG